MFQLNIDVSQLILVELSLLDTIKLSELDREHNQLIHQDWIWSARTQLDYPYYANHKNLPIFNRALEKYRYIKQNNGQIYVLTYSGFRCYYDNIAEAYAKFKECVIIACNLQPETYDLEKIKEYRASIYNGLILLYREIRDQETELIYVSDRDSGILYPNFLALPNALAAPYYCYEWHVAHKPQCICNETSNSLFELPSEANLDNIVDISTNNCYCYKSYY